MEDTENDNDTEGMPQPTQELCTQEVTALFPDICLQSLQSIAAPLNFSPQAVINHILDLTESGQTYTKREQPKQASGKRKRDTSEQHDDIEERVRKDRRLYTSDDRQQSQLSQRDPPLVTYMIAGDFPLVPIRTVQHFLSENNHLLFPTYLALNESIQQADKPWKYKKTRTVQSPRYKEDNIEESIRSANRSLEREQQEIELMEELKAARLARRHANLMRQKELEALEAEKRNFDEALSKGEIKECECCFVDTAENRLVHCNAENTHFFCIQCARRNAESQVGLSKYELECLSMEGCKARFSYRERQKFLTESLAFALDRIEQDESLRLAELSDLAKCPFCSYAEEYPPVAIDKEFRCRKPDCMVTSCRLCNLETHIPKTCKEAAAEKGLDIRREVEEAMSKALIRNCNKCNTPFVKESGCNKMTCTKAGCRNMQCYVCHKSCDYSHFDQPSRGGKAGNCPLFEDSEKRHREEVEEAEKNAKQKVLQENPDLEPGSLDFALSSNVKRDDARRMEKSAAGNQAHDPHRHHDHRHGNYRREHARALPRVVNEAIQRHLPRQQNEPVQQPQMLDNPQQQVRQVNQDLQQALAMRHDARHQQQRVQQLQEIGQRVQQRAQQRAQQQAQERIQPIQQMRQQALEDPRNLRQPQPQPQFHDAWQNLVKNPRPLPIPFQGAPVQQVQLPAPQPAPAELRSQQGLFPPIPIPIPDFMLNLVNQDQPYQFMFGMHPPDGNNNP